MADVVVNLVANTTSLDSALQDVKVQMTQVSNTAKQTGDAIKDSMKPGSNADLLKKNYGDINLMLTELNEKLRNEIALKKKSSTETAKRIKDLEKEKQAIDKQAQAMTRQQTLAQKMRGAFGKLGLAIGAAFAVRAVVNFAKTSIQEYRKVQLVQARLLAALNNRGDVQERLIAQATRLENITMFDADDIVKAQTFVAAQGRSEEQINKVITAATELSSVLGVDIVTATRMVDMTFEGTIGRMGRLDQEFKNLTAEQLANGAAADLLIKKYGGMAEAMGKTDAGKIKQLGFAWGTLKEAIGERLSNQLAEASTGIKNFLLTLTDWTKIKLADKLEDEMTKVNGLALALSDANLPASQRNSIYAELVVLAPEVVAGLDRENISTAALAKNLAEYNKQAINRIVVAKAYQDVEDEQENAADKAIDLATKKVALTELLFKIEQDLSKQNSVQLKNVKNLREEYQKGNITIEEYARQTALAGAAAGQVGAINGEVVSIYALVEKHMQGVYKVQQKYNSALKDANKEMQTYQAVANALGIDISTITDREKAKADALNQTADNYDGLTAAITALETKQRDLLYLGMDLSAAEKTELAALKARKEKIDAALKGDRERRTEYEKMLKTITDLEEKIREQITLTGQANQEDVIALATERERKESIDALTESLQRYNEETVKITSLDFTADYDEWVAGLEEAQAAYDKLVESGEEFNTINNKMAADFPKYYAAVVKELEEVEEAFDDIFNYVIPKDSSEADILDQYDWEEILRDLEENWDKILDSGVGLLSEILTSGNEELRSKLEERVSIFTDSVNDIQSELDKELQLQEQGLANNVDLKKKELADMKALQDEAIRERDKQIEKERRQAKTAATLQAAAATVTILADAVKTGGVAGIVVGALAVASFLSLLLSGQSKAGSAIKFSHGTAEILGGKSHEGGGVQLGNYGEAEKGEFLGILSADKTRKFGKPMMTLFDGINKSNDDKTKTGLLELAGLTAPEASNTSVEMKEVKEIKGIYNHITKPVKSVVYENGRRVEKVGNITRIIYVN